MIGGHSPIPSVLVLPALSVCSSLLITASWLLISLFLKGKGKVSQLVSDSLRPQGLYSPWNSPGQNTGVGSLSLFQGIFPTQGSNSGLPHCKQILYQLSHQGSPRILEWVGYPFSRGSSWPRNRTGVSCIAGGFFTSWAIREASLFNQPITFGDSFQFWLFFSFQFILFYRVLLYHHILFFTGSPFPVLGSEQAQVSE